MQKRRISVANLLNIDWKDDMPAKIDELLHKPLVVICLGLKKFAESLEEQQVEVVQVDWVPPAGGDKAMADLLDQLL